MYRNNRVTTIIPALNEEQAIGKVICELLSLTDDNQQRVIDHIIVCDNGSTDNTAKVAQDAGAEVVFQAQAGYGIACLTALAHLPPSDIVLFVDGDHSCKAQQALPLLAGVSSGDDLAIGSRTLGAIEKGALTPVQLFGNWLSAQLIHLFWRQKTTDLGPFRAISNTALQNLAMADKSFGWTVEMQVKAVIWRMKVSEYPVDSIVRIGQSKISGTVKGSILAGVGILSMIVKLRLFYRPKLNLSAKPDTETIASPCRKVSTSSSETSVNHRGADV